MGKTAKEIIFFVLVGLIYGLYFIFSHKYACALNTGTGKITLTVTSIIFGLTIFGMAQIMGLFKSEKFKNFPMNQFGSKYSINPRLCQGGSYMHQGPSYRASMCRAMASNPKGAAMIASNQCRNGYVGMPKTPFIFTPESNSCWKNERCNSQLPTTICDNVQDPCNKSKKMKYDYVNWSGKCVPSGYGTTPCQDNQQCENIKMKINGGCQPLVCDKTSNSCMAPKIGLENM
jgi:hypothetical protein